MKNTFAIILLLLSGISMNAQIQLEQSYSHSGALTEIEPGVFKYYMMDVPLKQVRLYNEDHTIYKTISLTVPAGYYLYDVKYPSKYTFNTDDNIELLYIYQKTEVVNSISVYTYGLKVISETGSVLLNLQDGGFAEIMEASKGNKLLCYQYIWNSGYYLIYTNVYSLLEEDTKSASSEAFKSSIVAYPNPLPSGSQLKLSIPDDIELSEYRISNIKGQSMASGVIINEGNRAELDVTNLPAGTFILNLNSGKDLIYTTKFEKQ